MSRRTDWQRTMVSWAALTLGALSARAATVDAWRSAEGFQGWQVGPDGLVFDGRAGSSVIAAQPITEERGEITFELVQTYGPWARLQLRFRTTGDEQTYIAAVLEPAQRRLSLLRKEEGRFVDVPDGLASIKPLAARRHRLGYRIEGPRVIVSLDGSDLLDADLKGIPAKGRVGLAAAFAHVEIRDVNVQSAANVNVKGSNIHMN